MVVNLELSLLETRVIGALIEKEITTPDQYPLSLNGLMTACNQKSNREPVLSLSEQEVQATADALIKKNLISEAQGSGSRVVKYKHRFCNTEFGKLKLTEQELGIVCLLFLRGPQTPGELRSRSNRLCKFNDVAETESVLNTLAGRDDGPFVVRLPREAGKRESRYGHLFSGEVEVVAAEDGAVGLAAVAAGGDDDRIAALEMEVADLKEQVANLTEMVNELIG